MSEYDLTNLKKEKLLLIVTSTFGNGDPPEQAENMRKYLIDLSKSLKAASNTSGIPLNNVKFSVFALGNSSYGKFCGFGNLIDSLIYDLGAHRLYEKGIGDELRDQEASFQKWSIGVFKVYSENFSSRKN
jgi:sulfite reductase alpha subunit-like flavoprotein